MKTFTALALAPVFIGALAAQKADQSTTTTTTTTYSGTLLDAGCVTTHTERNETTTNPADPTTTTTTKTTKDVTDCPVTAETRSFALQTPEGRIVRFDEPSNTRVVEVVRSNKGWTKSITERTPVRVQIVGTPNGETFVVRSIE